MCPWGYVVRYTGPDGKTVKVKALPGTPEFDGFWCPFLKDFAQHLKDKGWFKDTFIAMDERSPEDVLYIANFVQKHAPGMRISMAGNRKPSDFKGIVIDSYSQSLGHVTADFLAECPERRAKGFITTHYVCCGPRYPNTFMDSAPGEAFWNGAYPGFVGLDGFLRWAWNSWGEDAMKDATYWNWLAGDTFLVYPGEKGPIDSIRWEIFAESLQDYALLQTLGIDREDKLLSQIKSFKDFPAFSTCSTLNCPRTSPDQSPGSCL
jgi:hypothetical protein